jgi:hypothetical protein
MEEPIELPEFGWNVIVDVAGLSIGFRIGQMPYYQRLSFMISEPLKFWMILNSYLTVRSGNLDTHAHVNLKSMASSRLLITNLISALVPPTVNHSKERLSPFRFL